MLDPRSIVSMERPIRTRPPVSGRTAFLLAVVAIICLAALRVWF